MSLSQKKLNTISIEEEWRRFTYMENVVSQWLVVAVGILMFGVLVHINLNYYVGISIVFDGLSFGGVTLIGAIVWLSNRKNLTLRAFMVQRQKVLYTKYVLFVILIGLSIWAAIVMIQRSQIANFGNL